MTKKLLSACFALMLFLPLALAAQTTVSATASITVDPILALSVTNTTINFSNASAAGYVTTVTTSAVSHSGNCAHSVSVLADDPYFTSTSGLNDTEIASTALELTLDGGSSWGGLDDVTPLTIVSGAAGGNYPSDKTVGYRMSITASNPPDTYTLGFTFSVVAD